MYSFFAMMARMKYINRWALMRNTREEDVSEHSLEVAMIAHGLAILSKERYSIDVDEARVALKGIYHDANEIITGDMPTPIKYKNDELKSAYKEVEAQAARNLLALLPEELKGDFTDLLTPDLSDEKRKEVHRLVKVADRISAFLKCLMEEKAANDEFRSAKESIEKSIHDLNCEEAEYYLAHFVPPYGMTLDEISK